MIGTRVLMVLGVATCVGGCATSMRGTQVVWVTTTPPGAQCTLSSADAEAVVVASTPGRVSVARGQSDLVVVCRKDGHHDGRTLLISGTSRSPLLEAIREGKDPGPEPPHEAAEREAVIAAHVGGGVAAAGAAVGTQALVNAAVFTGATAAVVILPVAVIAAPIAYGASLSSGYHLSYPSAASVTLLPREFADREARDEAAERTLAAIDRDDEALRKRFDATCGRTCKQRGPAFEMFLAERRADLIRQRETAVLVAR